MPDGEVWRYHPTSMQRHVMRWGCTLFNVDSASLHGVGAVLHARPPRREASSGALQRGHALVIREDMNDMCRYDIQQYGWNRVNQTLLELGPEDQELDWSNGEDFPWWVWLANTGRMRDVSNDGITSVRVRVENNFRCVIVYSLGGIYTISAGSNGRPLVHPQPRRYDPSCSRLRE